MTLEKSWTLANTLGHCRHRETIAAFQSIKDPSAVGDGYPHVLLGRSLTA